MKTKFYSAIISIASLAVSYKVNAQANQQLSNLIAPTRVNVNLLPDIDNAHNLGVISKSWKNVYLDGSVFLGGTRFLAYQTGTGAGNTAVGASALNANTTGNFNTGVGFNALLSNNEGYDNTATGYYSLHANTSGHANSALGASALSSNATGNYNTAVGSYAMANNSTGSANVAVGVSSMNANTSGVNNSVLGVNAFSRNTIGNNNTACGFAALNINIRGNSNVAVGVWSLHNNENGSNLVAVGDSALLNLNSYWCTAVGSKAGLNNTTGSKNTYLGYHAGITVTTGASNTIIGAGADVSNGTIMNSTAIGNAATVNASNKVRIGNSSVTSIGGQVGWTNFSDERIKTNITENVPGVKFINLLRPVTYRFDIDKEEKILNIKEGDNNSGKYDITQMQFTGFLAREVEVAAKKIGYDFSGVDVPKNDNDLYGLRYAEFVVPLVKAVQELSEENNELKSEVQNLKSEMNELKAIVLAGSQSEASMQRVTINGKPGTASLEQSIPNPFNQTTTINYSLPAQYSSAKIIVTDRSGKVLKEINLSGSGKSRLTVDAGTLASGAYQYSLYLNGKLIDTKQMELLK